MMRAIPLVRLARFPGFPVTEPEVAAAVRRFAEPEDTGSVLPRVLSNG